MAEIHITLSQEEILGLMQENRPEAFKELLQKSLNTFIQAESEEKLKAKPYERTSERTDSRNGTRERTLNTRIGSIILTIPRHREVPFHSLVYDNYQRNEAALVLSMAEMVVEGVSTRKVSKVMEKLCGSSFSKSTVSQACEKLDLEIEEFRNRKLTCTYPFVFVDATGFSVREDHKVVSKSLMIAIGMNEFGKREVIDFEAYQNESNETWNLFFARLKSRGLRGVHIITSDAHKGILHAMHEHFPQVPWQRCHYHFTKNIVEKAPKRFQEGLRSELRTMFTARDMETATKKMKQIAEDYRDVAEESVTCLEKGFLDSMTNLSVPVDVRRYIRTTNHLERLNKELKRRSHVIGIFPNVESLIRLMGAVLLTEHEKWSNSSHRYFYGPMVKELKQEERELAALAEKQYALFVAA